MRSLAITLLGLINTTSFHSTNHQIARYVLENLERVEYLSEPDLARACSVSKSSVNRFCKELGYPGFAQFQADVLRFNRRHAFKYVLPPAAPDEPLPAAPAPDDPTLLGRYCAAVARTAARLAANVSDETLRGLARDLDAYERVIVMGEMQSGDVAQMFQHNLFEAGRVVTASVYAKEQRELVSNLEPGTLVIVFSLFGRFFHRLEKQHGIVERPEGTKLCWITSCPMFAPASRPDLVIDLGVEKNLTAGNLAMEMVANVVTMHYWQQRNG